MRSPVPHLMVARAESRQRWRSLVGLVLVIGVAGGAVLFGLTAIRRSSSALDRYLELARTSDATFALSQADPGEAESVVAALPEVEETHPLHLFPVGVDGERLIVHTSPDPRVGHDVDRPRLIEGRRPRSANEVLVNESAVASFGLRVGDRVTVRPLTPAALARLVDGRLPESVPFEGEQLVLEVVGIDRPPESLVTDVGADQPVARAGPEFLSLLPSDTPRFEATAVQLAPGVDSDEFERAAGTALPAGESLLVESAREELRTSMTQGVTVVVIGLVVFSALALLAGGFVVAQSVGRHMSIAGQDRTTLLALGFDRADRAAVLVLSVLAAVTGGVVLAAAISIALSPSAVLGVARRADPDSGPNIDWTVVAGGGLALLALCALGVGLLAWRHAGMTRARAVRGGRGWTGLQRSGAPFPIQIGSWLAFARMPGMQVRGAVLGLLLAVTGMVAASLFTVTADQRTATGSEWGRVWDLDPEPPHGTDDWVSLLPDEVTATAEKSRHSVVVDGRRTGAMTIRPVRGELVVPILSGRPPRAPGEVALGRQTMRRSGLQLGETVTVRWASGQDGEDNDVSRGARARSIEATIVGEAVLDLGIYENEGPGHGVFFSPEGYEQVIGPRSSRTTSKIALVSTPVVIDDGADVEAVRDDLAARGFTFTDLIEPSRPRRVGHLAGALEVPRALVALFALLGVVGLAHALWESTRRRRQFFGVLAALGAVKGQLRSAVLVQGLAIGALAVVVGVPAGLLIGSRVWGLVAGAIGIDGRTTGAVEIGLAVMIFSLTIALLVAAWPAWRWLRHVPTDALRGE